MKQLMRIGLQSHQLTTKELVEMFFEMYNPTVSESFVDEASVTESQTRIATQYKDDSPKDDQKG